VGTVTIPGLLNNSENSSEYTASNGSLINEKSVAMDAEGNGLGSI